MEIREIQFNNLPGLPNLDYQVHSVQVPQASVTVSVSSGTFPSGINNSYDISSKIEIPGLISPQYRFNINHKDNSIFVKSYANGSWPNIYLEVEINPLSKEGTVRSFVISPSERTVEAILIYSRVMLLWLNAGKCTLQIDSNIQFDVIMRSHKTLAQDKQETLILAKFIRKLAFIESLFPNAFKVIPNEISLEQIIQTEDIFRGITEGEFISRMRTITFLEVILSKEDLNKPPYTIPGKFIYKAKKDYIPLLGRNLDVGPISIIIEEARLTKSRDIDRLSQQINRPSKVSFTALNHQIKHRFEQYIAKNKKEQQRQKNLLEAFINKLKKEEPENIAALINSSLINDVDYLEAIEITTGWLQWHHLPNHFVAQSPYQDPHSNNWHVEIAFSQTGKRVGVVGTVEIDKTSGIVLQYTNIDEIVANGEKLRSVIKVDKAIPQFGSAKGLIHIPENFDDPLEDFDDYTK